MVPAPLVGVHRKSGNRPMFEGRKTSEGEY
jgi:hypothetical protein